MRSICLLQQLLRAKVRGTEYREANDPETEIWRALSEILHYSAAGEPVPAQVYIVDRTRRILTSICFAFPGVKSCQANTLRSRGRYLSAMKPSSAFRKHSSQFALQRNSSAFSHASCAL